jgi:hypothetical protein
MNNPTIEEAMQEVAVDAANAIYATKEERRKAKHMIPPPSDATTLTWLAWAARRAEMRKTLLARE